MTEKEKKSGRKKGPLAGPMCKVEDSVQPPSKLREEKRLRTVPSETVRPHHHK
jgi:hypothetical protein